MQSLHSAPALLITVVIVDLASSSSWTSSWLGGRWTPLTSRGTSHSQAATQYIWRPWRCAGTASRQQSPPKGPAAQSSARCCGTCDIVGLRISGEPARSTMKLAPSCPGAAPADKVANERRIGKGDRFPRTLLLLLSFFLTLPPSQHFHTSLCMLSSILLVLLLV